MVKNKDFFYLQYDKINWTNQEKTKINYFLYKSLIKNIILKEKDGEIKLFDIGFGIGSFIKMLQKSLKRKYKKVVLEGCEPSKKNYEYAMKKVLRTKKRVQTKLYNTTFLKTKTNEKFDFISSIYTFTNFMSEELQETARKTYSMLNKGGKFILVVGNEPYLKEKLESKKDLFIEKNKINLGNKKYEETLFYSEIPKIGKVIDYNRNESFYVDLFEKEKFNLIQKSILNDHGFVATIFTFEKN